MALHLGDGLADLAGLSSDSSFQVNYGADAALHLAIPLATTFDPDGLRVLDTTGVSAHLGVDAAIEDLQANIGPLTLALDGVAKVGASLKVGRDDRQHTGQ